MIVAHLADLHLGYRAYHRAAPGGVNQRERDVAQAFRTAVDRLGEVGADVVLVAGDVFHSVRPPNAAIADAFRQFARLREKLPDAPIVVIAGNHDAPRSVEAGSILRLLAEIPGVTVVEGVARAVHLPEIDTTVLCVPHSAVAAESGRLALEPDPAASHNLLMLHACVTGPGVDGRLRFLGEFGVATVDVADIQPGRWDYVALGHYHIHTEIAPNACYAGSLERTSPNIWEEADSPKGFVTYDTGGEGLRFHEIETRPVIDLPRICARAEAEAGHRYLEADELDAWITDRVAAVPGGLEGRIVRLVLEDVPRELFRALDHRRLRAYRAEALHFHLDVRRPSRRATAASDEPEQRRTLEQELESFLRERWTPSTRSLERERLVALALGYLADAGPVEELEFMDDAVPEGGSP